MAPFGPWVANLPLMGKTKREQKLLHDPDLSVCFHIKTSPDRLVISVLESRLPAVLLAF